MSIEDAAKKPQRMTLTNMHTGEPMEVQFNPEQLPEELTVNYTRLTVPGMSHQQIQYINTNNHGFTLELFLEALGGERSQEKLEDQRNFILSLMYPVAGASDVPGGAPPRVLFVWPRLATFTAVVTRARFIHTHFASTGAPIRTTATVELEEVRDGRLTSEEVRATGTRRSSGG